MSIQGRLRYFQKDITSGNDLEITPANGETMFVYSSSYSIGANVNAEVTISNDNMAREVFLIPKNSTPVVPYVSPYFDSLVGDNVKMFMFATSASTVRVSVFAWVENTSRIRDVTG